MIENFEEADDEVEGRRGPDQTGVVFNLCVRDTHLVVFDLLIDIIQLQVKLVYHRSVREIAATLS